MITSDEELSEREFLAAYASGRRDFRGVEILSDGESLLAGAVLDDLDLQWGFLAADLRGASLRRANFAPANVKTCSFDGADLTDADFRGAALCSTSFSGARMAGARFDGATIHSHVVLTGDQKPDW